MRLTEFGRSGILNGISFTVLADPVAQGRPRFANRGSFVSVYDPPKSKKYKDELKQLLSEEMTRTNFISPIFEPDAPLGLYIVFMFAMPVSMHRKTRTVNGFKHVRKPDVENLAKIVMDAMSGIIYADDKQVCDLQCQKLVADQGVEGSTRVQIWRKS